MKNPLKVAALAAALALTLTACSSSTEPEVSPPASGLDLTTIEWTETDGVPGLTFEAPVAMTATDARVVADGTGEQIVDGMIVEADYTIFNGLDGELVYSTYTTGQTEPLPISADELDPVLYEVLTNSRVGVTLIYGAPDYSSETASAVLFAMTIVSARTPLTQAEGTPVEPVEGLPVVTLDAAGKPSIDFTDAVEPAELVSQLLIEGTGDAVEEGDTVRVNYTGWLWDGEQFDSSWDLGTPLTTTLAQGALIEGWVQGLQGVPVGSQVLLVVPAELGYGETGQGDIPPGATLVFVLDVLDAS